MKSRHALTPDIEYTESTTKEQRKQMREANQPQARRITPEEWAQRFDEPYPEKFKEPTLGSVSNRFNPRGDAS